MDIGCAVGRTSFELTRWFDKVTGLDYSARFIQVASMLQTLEQIPYKLGMEGEIVQYRFATLRDKDNIEAENTFMSKIFDCKDDHASDKKIRKSEEYVHFI